MDGTGWEFNKAPGEVLASKAPLVTYFYAEGTFSILVLVFKRKNENAAF